ncbi:50S ribosomal protein L10 [Candidatus Peregrinibacteria bacterium CG1_02_54_53]|nr:MAG: 50S ribosomal protein L10 [Candidatus Peregrinibacteria bacterium CG1_02_54_53]
MAVTRAQKEAQLTELKEKMSKAQSTMFAQYIGLTVSEVGELRQMLKEADAEMKVAKKTLMRIATKDSDLPEISEKGLEGPVACIFSFADPLSGAQVAFKFAKDHKQVQLIGGIFDGKLLSKEEAMEMAKMPDRQQLLAIFAMMLRSPLVSFASACSSPLTGMARGLSELAKKNGSSATPPSDTPQS